VKDLIAVIRTQGGFMTRKTLVRVLVAAAIAVALGGAALIIANNPPDPGNATSTVFVH